MAETTIISFWGKGGVGKTTLSALAALGLTRQGYRVFAISTDPAPTLCRVLGGMQCRGRPLEVQKSLVAFELSEKDVISLWKERFGDEVYTVISSFLPVDESIIDYIAGAPGISDEFTMYYIYEVWRSSSYDYIVWDTPAAGGSLRLLRIEYELYRHLTDAAKLYLRVRGVLDKIRRSRRGDPLQLIEEWRTLAKGILDMLASGAHRAYIVAVPDDLSFEVAKTILEEFKLHSMKARKIIVNMVYGREVGKKLKTLYLRQERSIRRFLEEFSREPGICLLPFIDAELYGYKLLEILWGKLRECL